MSLTFRHFYLFSGFHSLLIGLLPFFIPVLLWNSGASLIQISIFIAISGIGFITTLWCWDRLRFQQRWSRIIVFSFLSEILLASALLTENNTAFLAGIALLNGTYSCFYWSTQRAIFSEITTKNNTGKVFGNFQILVVILLKIGILTGGYLLEKQRLIDILLLSVLISVIALFQFKMGGFENSEPDSGAPPIYIKDIWHFNDQNHSKFIFLLDGPFLFLESYFWVLTLYLLTQQNFFKLGILLVLLAVFLSIIFFLLKNIIDQVRPQPVFILAVLLYAFSWLLRAQLSTDTNDLILYPVIILIAFLTTFFRLVFNKRFFDVAKQKSAYRYLILKSYYSQWGITIFFSLLALFLVYHRSITSSQQLTWTYGFVCPLALFYSVYANTKFTFYKQLILSKLSRFLHNG